MNADVFSLEGKTALITGGTGGLGSAIAREFLSRGADVIVCATRMEKAAPLLESTKGLPGKLSAVAVNLTEPASVEQMLDTLAESVPHLDILVNAAGCNILLPAESYDDESFSHVMELNIHTMHRMCREVGKRWMIPQKYGRILNISSVKSFIGTGKDYAAYCASKGAVNMYTRQLACEWGKYGITCNAIAPTFVRTPINSFQLDDPVFYQSLVARIPLGRIGKEQDIAQAAVYLCSDASAFVSGQILAIDGGLTARQ